jgi:hypothetical protein
MRVLLACAAVVAVLALLPTSAHAVRPRPGGPSAGQTCANAIHGGDREAARRYCASVFEGERMSRGARNCLIAAAITTGGVLAGGIIGQLAARAIAGDLVKTGTAVCVGLLVAG